jgi:glycerate kinase
VKGVPDTVLVAPDSFKGTHSAGGVARAIASGLGEEGWAVDECPVADGGEGTREILRGPLGGQPQTVRVHDPLGREVEAQFDLVAERGGHLAAVVESAAAAGLALVSSSERDPVAASTYGVGELILAAVGTGAKIVFLGVGGSATTDGGTGAIRALERGGGISGVRLVVLCDVRTAFEDAAHIFAPQKGATSEQVRRLTARLHTMARRLPRDPRGLPLTGAAGGLSGGLWAAFGAELVPGASFALDLIGFDARLRAARAVVTGEGRIDRQSLAGKALGEVSFRARQAGVPSYAIVGQSQLEAFDQRILDLQLVLEAGSIRQISSAARRLARLI